MSATPTYPADHNGKPACALCGIAVYMHQWVTNRRNNCHGKPVQSAWQVTTEGHRRYFPTLDEATAHANTYRGTSAASVREIAAAPNTGIVRIER